MPSLPSIAQQLKSVLHERLYPLNVAGAVVGVAVGTERIALAHGLANINTGAPFTPDTGFLLGSVTKILTTTVLMRLVDRGAVDLDAPVKRYVPEFALSDPDAAAAITVRMLVNHTNGIDADTVFPISIRGKETSRFYTSYLPKLGVLFEPGTCIHYTNPGFSLAARVIEEITGEPFERAMQFELFDRAGMPDSTALQTQAFLRRTAVGAIPNPATGGLQATKVFTLGEAAAGAGSTLIVSADDMLAFGRMHLDNGVTPDGTRVLSADSAKAMRTQTFDLGIPQTPPVGLGWWFFPIAGTTAYWHGGGSPGGTSSFCIIPELDATIISFATGTGSSALNDELHNTVIEALTGREITPPLTIAPQSEIRAGLAGVYESFQKRLDVSVNGDELVVSNTFVPYDDEHREVYDTIWRHGYGGPVAYKSVAPGQFIRKGAEPKSFSGFYGRMGLIADLPASGKRRAGLHTGFRYTPKTG